MTLGQRIQAHRTRLGLSQEGLGDKLGVSRQAVSKWEADGAVPDTDKLIALSKLFGITLNELLQVEEPSLPESPVPARPRRRVVLPVVLAAALALLAGLNLWLSLRVNWLEEQVASLEQQSQPLDPKAMVAGWDFNILTDWNEAGMGVQFQVTTARYDPEENLEVFFLVNGTDGTSQRKTAEGKPNTNGVYTATMNFENGPLSSFTLSVGFVRDGVEYVQPLAEFDSLTYDGSSYTSFWP